MIFTFLARPWALTVAVTFQDGGAYLDLVSVCHHQHLVELHAGTLVCGNLLDLEGVALGDPVLLTTSPDDGVHE